MLTLMTIALTPEQEERLRTLQAEGVQPTQFVDAALDLLERNQTRLAELNTELQAGIDDGEAGRFKTYSADNSQALLNDVKRRASEL